MLEDRDYMRQPEYHTSRVSFTVLLLVVNAAVFIIQLSSANLPNGLKIQDDYFALSLIGLKQGYVWQLLTFQFMHAGWMHLLFNSLAIYFFGRTVETAFGSRRFLSIYLISGMVGGLVQMLFALLLPSFDSPVVGASAGASGLVAAFAVLNWTEPFTLILYFIPVTMRGRTLLWVSIGMAVFGILNVRSHVANAAHLGGILVGFIYARQVLHGHWPQWHLFPRRERPRKVAVTRSRENKFWRSGPAEDEEVSSDNFLQDEVDPILEKISAHGIQSLTSRERNILEAARKKMK
ncbi:MAG TPA: rhomboid family intramembrane serine protease [Candidatus Acidoferrum sp.]|nr:rhomboid family intramembrane serine protease [Candidatus Acidoferrum sp.]